jgi:hypothetical protein
MRESQRFSAAEAPVDNGVNEEASLALEDSLPDFGPAKRSAVVERTDVDRKRSDTSLMTVKNHTTSSGLLKHTGKMKRQGKNKRLVCSRSTGKHKGARGERRKS